MLVSADNPGSRWAVKKLIKQREKTKHLTQKYQLHFRDIVMELSHFKYVNYTLQIF